MVVVLDVDCTERPCTRERHAAERHGQVQVQQGQQVVAGFLNEVAAATDALTFAQVRSPPMYLKAHWQSHRMGYPG